MAFPTIPTIAAGRVVVATTTAVSGTRTFPTLNSLTKNAGDLLIAIIVAYQSSGTPGAVFSAWGAGFTEFGDFSGGGTSTVVGCAYKFSTGTETGTFTVTQAPVVTGHAAFILLSIPDAHASTPPEAGGYAAAANANADSGSLGPVSWGVDDTLWLSVCGIGETSTGGAFQGIIGGGTNYTDLAVTGPSADVVGAIEGGVMFRQLAADTEDPASFNTDTSNARYGAITIAVRPPFVPVLVEDDFNRADSDTVGNDSLGNAWVEASGDYDISNNGVIQTDATTTPGLLRCGTNIASDHWVEATLAASNGTGQVGFCTRVDATAFTGVFMEIADDFYKVIQVTNGSPDTVSTGSAHTHTTGERYRAESEGTTVRLFLNDTQVHTFTTSFAAGNTRVGLHLNENASGAVRFDNFRAGTLPYTAPEGETNAPAETATATGQAFDVTAEILWPMPQLLMAPMVAP